MAKTHEVIWKALADESRRTILDCLRDGPRTTGELCERFETSRFATMKHLGVLERAGLITVRWKGRERFNYLNAVPIQQVYDRWIRAYERHWATALISLKNAVETKNLKHKDLKEKKAMKESMPMQQANMIHIASELTIDAKPTVVFDALTKNVGSWWGRPYASDRAKSVTLEAKLGGLFLESYGDGDGEIWGTVTAFDRNRKLELTGPCGMSGAVFGVIVYELEGKGSKTVLKLTHHAMGEVTERTRAMYAEGWQDLLDNRLRAFVEKGKASGVEA